MSQVKYMRLYKPTAKIDSSLSLQLHLQLRKTELFIMNSRMLLCLLFIVFLVYYVEGKWFQLMFNEINVTSKIYEAVQTCLDRSN